MNVNIVIAGAAGQGLKTVNNILSKFFFKLGYNIYSTKDYMSRIRGGHNFMQIRVGTEPLTSAKEEIDILIALNKFSITKHQERIKENGYILFDGEIDFDNAYNIPAKEIAKDLGNPKVANIALVGAALKLLDINLNSVNPILKKYFKSEEIASINSNALQAGYKITEEKLPFEKMNTDTEMEQVLINGNDAIGLGAAIGGVQFYSAYPMTPSTGIMNYLAKHENKLNIVVEQAEDELAALNMALGASYGGIRAMTGTSGGGFALMNEALGLAGVAELPVVIANVQRPGPATGMPTRTGQGDLSFVINSSQGEIPLMVTAPRSSKDAFYQAYKAMNLAEKYQMPIVILSDQYLADTKQNFKAFDIEALENKNYYYNKKKPSDIEDFKRYELTKNGISNLVYPGQLKNTYVFADSHEHTEYGRITENKEIRNKMVDKRNRKLETFIHEDLEEPKYVGPEEPEYILISWGSTYGPVLEAQKNLENVGVLSFNHVWPLPTKKLETYKDSATFVVIENNSTGQFSKLIQQETCIEIKHQLLKYDGRPFTGTEIINRFKSEVK